MVCRYIFGSPEEASLFAPSFVDQIIKSGIITDKQAFINGDKTKINTGLMELVVVELTVCTVDEKGTVIGDKINA